MDLLLLRLHQKQIFHQCNAAISSIQQADLALKNYDQEIFWASIQNFLTATANISKALWGQGGRFATERAPLRESLSIEDNSPLSSTDLRNHLEHYDERLDQWYKTSTSHNYADFIIGPQNSTIVGLESTDIFRFFDPETTEVIFWGKRYKISPLVVAIRRLHEKAKTESIKPHWE